MQITELLKLTEWFEENIAENGVPAKYVALYNKMNQNIRRNTNQQLVPFEQEKENLYEAIKEINFQSLSLEQINFLNQIEITELIGKIGVQNIEQILIQNNLDIATATAKIKESSDTIAKAQATINELSTTLSKSFDIEESEEVDENKVLMRVYFQNDVAIENLTNFKKLSANWYDIGRGIAMAQANLVRFTIADNGAVTLDGPVVSNFESYDTEGNGELQIALDGSAISMYNYTSYTTQWTGSGEAEIRTWPLSDAWLPVESDVQQVAIGGNVGKGSLLHTGDDIFYTQQTHDVEFNSENTMLKRLSNAEALAEEVGDLRVNKNNKFYYFAQGKDSGQEYSLTAATNVPLTNLPASNSGGTGYQPYQPYTLNGVTPDATNGLVYRNVGKKYYELKDDLGNVRVVVNDRKDLNTTDNALTANVVSYNNFYPFGMLQPNRNFDSQEYRYGFQGQEKDSELKGEGNSVNYKYRMLDSRIGRFFAVDPLTAKYPHYSPYSFSGNKVIHAVELEGLEESRINQAIDWNTAIKLSDENATKEEIMDNYEYIHNYDSRKVNTQLFKSLFKSNLAKKFVERYASFDRGTLSLTHEEVVETHPSAVSIIHGNHPETMASEKAYFNSKLKSIEKGSSKYVELNVIGKANTKGTLGNFTIKFRGKLSRDAEGEGWEFNGVMQFYDEWNFEAKKKGLRSVSSEDATAKGKKYLQGRPFKIESPVYSVSEKSEDGAVDWFENKDSSSDELTPVGKTLSKY